MPNYTENFNLEKPLESEYYDINVFNENADKLDAALKTITDNAEAAGETLETAMTYLGVNPITAAANDTPANWAEKKTGYAYFDQTGCLDEQPERYGFLISYVQGGGVSQIWLSRPTGAAYLRHGDTSNGWRQNFQQIYDEAHKPTPADIGAVKTTGDTMTGDLTIEKGLPMFYLRNTSGERYANFQVDNDGNLNIWNSADSSNTNFITIKPETSNIENSIRFTHRTNGSTNVYNVLTEANAKDIVSEQITPADIGALSTTGTAASATKLAAARTIRTNLASTSTASFDGSANITPGVTGTLPVANGGTGATTAAAARTNLGITPENIGALSEAAGETLETAMTYMGVNPITATANDTPANWAEKKTGYAYFNKSGYLTEQPEQYGFLISYVQGIYVSQIWLSRPTGPAYLRHGDTSPGWRQNLQQIYDEAHKPTPADIGALPLTGGTMTGQIIRNVPDSAYVNGRDKAVLRMIVNISATSFYPILSM